MEKPLVARHGIAIRPAPPEIVALVAARLGALAARGPGGTSFTTPDIGELDLARRFAQGARLWPLAGAMLHPRAEWGACHEIAAETAESDPVRYGLVFGWARDEADEHWRTHSWNWDRERGAILEPTPLLRRAYAGVLVAPAPLAADELVRAAARFARDAHRGQTRSGSSRPYLEHPAATAAILAERYPERPWLVAAGWLHDTVEDCGTTLEELSALFGHRVALLVRAVTRTPGWRLIDHAADLDAVRLKTADTVSNLRDTARDLAAGEEVWSRFRSGRGKIRSWEATERVASTSIGSEPLVAELRRLLELVRRA